VFKGRIAAELAQLEVGLHEDVLANVFEFGGISGETGRHAEDPAFVAAGELGKGMIIPGKRVFHELLVRG
jgi:hypothetical protein